MRTRVLVAVLVGVLWAIAVGALEVPYLGGRVNDLADMIPAGDEQRIEETLRRLEEDTGAQVVVLTIPSLEGQPLEDYSMRVVDTWELGRKDVDDGVLLLVARDDRKIRIEVGYGLEPVLTDALSRRIVDHVLQPRFRAGEFGQGIEEAVAAIAAVARGEEADLPAPDGPHPMVADQPAVAVLVFLVFAGVVGMFSFIGLFSKGCSGWFLYLFLTPFYVGFPAAILGPRIGGIILFAWLVLFPLARLLVWRTGAGRDLRRARPGWVVVPSSGGGWSSRGGFSGGGFSGGGGSFGGGGASGGW